ncbi:MAG: aminomethyl-transferring glycine dehydrogenase subunit GcvPA [Armatimonadia bacterium]|nr:aminomethyl-transferring glycine dehydrogenase subunit GcvPA [Armatimonadia bacterium]
MALATPRDADGRAMLGALGLESAAELFDQVPESIRLSGALSLPGPLSEPELLTHMEELAQRDLHSGTAPCFAGGGIYDHFSPSVVDHLIQRGEFMTAYTSYQPEMSQGFLTAMYEFQTMVSRLYGLEVANASLYDAGTGLAEAALLAYEKTRRDRVVVTGALNPQYLECLRTALGPELGDMLTHVPHTDGLTDLDALKADLDDTVACVIVQQPSYLGTIESLPEIVEAAKAVGAKTVVCADPIAMAVLQTPGGAGADIAVGEGQPLGLPMSYGGPLLGLLATTRDLVRTLPGRVVGATVDSRGERGYVLTLQTREQHIRREKATSNICTNQGLCALAATIYLSVMGPRGLRRVASLCVTQSHRLRKGLAETALEPLYDAPFFREFAVRSPIPVPELQARMGDAGFVVGSDISAVTGVENTVLLAATESRTDAQVDAFVHALKGAI